MGILGNPRNSCYAPWISQKFPERKKDRKIRNLRKSNPLKFLSTQYNSKIKIFNHKVLSPPENLFPENKSQ